MKKTKIGFINLIFLLATLLQFIMPNKDSVAASSTDVYDVILFWGQSNMTGYCGWYDNEKEADTRYNYANTTSVQNYSNATGIDTEFLANSVQMNYTKIKQTSKTVYEYQYLTNKLVELNENTTNVGEQLLYDSSTKKLKSANTTTYSIQKSSGTNIVPEFCKTYYQKTGHKVVAVLASNGGEKIANFLPSTDSEYGDENNQMIYESMAEKYNSAVNYMTQNGYTIGNKLWVSFQGEADVSRTSGEDYKKIFLKVKNNLKNNLKISKGAIIETSHQIGLADRWYSKILEINNAQKQLAEENSDIVLGSTYSYDRFVPEETTYNSNNFSTKIYVDSKGNKLPYSDAFNMASKSVCYPDNTIHFTSAALCQIGKETAENLAASLNPKVIITGQAAGVSTNLLRYYDGNNNLGNGNSSEISTWKDLSGNKNGTINGAKANTSGYMLFDGVDDWINLGEINNLNKVTLQTEITMNTIEDDTRIIMCNYENGGVGLYLSAGKPIFQAYINGKYVQAKMDEELEPNRNYNIAGVYDGNALKLYINGTLQATTAASGSIENPTDSTVMAIGTNPKGSASTAYVPNMKVYAVRIYSNSLTQNQIKQNMMADRIKPVRINTNSSEIKLSVIFTHSVTGFSQDDIEIKRIDSSGNEITGDKPNIKANTFSGSGNTYTFTLENIPGSSFYKVSVKDKSYTDTYNNIGSGCSIIGYRDSNGPNPTITANKPELTKEKNITYTIEFSEPITGFSKEKINITNGSKGAFEKINNQKYTIEVTNTGNCKQQIEIPEGACFDRVGNSNIQANKQIIIDGTAKEGDVTKDDKIDLKDVIAVLRHIVAKEGSTNYLTEEKKYIADVNSDGKINLKDAIAIMRIITKQ